MDSGQTLIKRLDLSRLLDDDYVVVVTGPQGVGKTAMVNRLYGLNGILPEVSGSGELMPVWIREHVGAREVTAHVRHIDGGCVRVTPLPVSEVAARLMGPQRGDVLVHLDVPAVFTGGDATSLLLLPGIEQNQTEPWVVLARHALTLSNACIFVSPGSSFAQASVHDLAGEVVRALDGRMPIFVVSKADHSPDNHEDLIVRLKAEKKSETHDGASGPSPEAAFVATRPGDGAVLREALRTALQTHASSFGAFRAQQALDRDMLASDLRSWLLEARRLHERQGIDVIITTAADERPLENLREAVEELRHDFERDVRGRIRALVGEAIKTAEDSIDGVGFLKNLRQSVVGRNRKDERALEAAAMDSLGIGTDRITRLMVQAIETATANRLPRHASPQESSDPFGARLMIESPTVTKDGREALIVHSATAPVPTPNASAKEPLSEEVVRDVGFLMGSNTTALPSTDHLAAAIRVTPALVLETLRVAEATRLAVDAMPDDLTHEQRVSRLTDNIGEARGNARAALKGVVLILGLDVAADGEADLLHALASVFTRTPVPGAAVAPTVAGVLAAPAILWATAGLAAVYAGVGLARSVVATKSENRAAVKALVRSAGDALESNVLEGFEVLMERLVQHVRRVIEDRTGAVRPVASRLGRAIAIADAEQALVRLESQATRLRRAASGFAKAE